MVGFSQSMSYLATGILADITLLVYLKVPYGLDLSSVLMVILIFINEMK